MVTHTAMLDTLAQEFSTTTFLPLGILALRLAGALLLCGLIGFEREARRFADAQGYSVDWDAVARLDDQSLINGVSQIPPFDAASKQALLETPDLAARCELLIQLMYFFGRQNGTDDRVTLQ